MTYQVLSAYSAYPLRTTSRSTLSLPNWANQLTPELAELPAWDSSSCRLRSVGMSSAGSSGDGSGSCEGEAPEDAVVLVVRLVVVAERGEEWGRKVVDGDLSGMSAPYEDDIHKRILSRE